MTNALVSSPLPLPVAALLRRARNAKSPRDRHDTAYRAWEVAIMLAAATRIAANAPPSFERPSIGDWVAVLRREEGPQLRSRAVLALHAFLRKAAFEETAAPQSVSASKLLEAIPRYRNRFVGHGTVLQDQGFYADGAAALVEGLEAVAADGMFGARTSRIIFVESVEIDGNGRERGRVIDLTGDAPRVLDEATASRLPQGTRPSRVYAWDAEASRATPLHPFAAYDVERERTYLFSGIGRRPEYLDFGSGERLSAAALDERFPGLESDLVKALRAAPATRAATDDEPADDAQRFSDFRILGKLGEGGMGEVYLAVQESLDRVVALKVIRSAQADDPVARSRFQREIRALARCDHPNVVKILSSGTERGALWYAMEHVEGADLAQVGRSLTSSSDLDTAVSSAMDAAFEERRALFPDAPPVPKARPESAATRGRDKAHQLAEVMRDAARGVAHIHERGILHRDIKPANLMLTPERRVVVMDLGLAAIKDASSSMTREKAKILGTLRYMPPEQLQRNLIGIDERADVYALGATFYELLTERPLFDGDTEARLLAQVLREEPVPARKANPALARDLAAIVHHCTGKDPAGRYGSMGALVVDLEAFLDGRQVAAREPTFAYYLSLAVRKNRALALAALGVVAILVVALVVSLGALNRAERETARAEAATTRESVERETAEAATKNALAASKREAIERAKAETANREKDLALGRARTIGLVSASQSEVERHPMCALLLAREGGRAEASPVPLNQLRSALLASRERSKLGGHASALTCAEFSPDGRLVLTAGWDLTARLWTVAGRQLAVLKGHEAGIMSAAFSPDGTRIVTSSRDRTARVWDLGGRELAVLRGHELGLEGAEFSDDGSHIVTASSDKTARIWDLSGVEVAVLRGHGAFVMRAAFSHDGKRVVTASGDSTARIWDLSGNELAVLRVRGVTASHSDNDDGDGDVAVTRASFSPDDSRVLTVSQDRTARVWDPAGKELVVLRGHHDAILSAVFSPFGTEILTASRDQTARLWDLSSRQLCLFRGHEGSVLGATFSPSGKLILTASSDETARIWDTSGKEIGVLRGHEGPVQSAVFSRDGGQIVTASGDATARVWAVSRDEGPVLSGHNGDVSFAAFSPTEPRIVTASADSTARVWSVGIDQPPTVLPHAGAVQRATFSSDGTRILTASADGCARTWDCFGAILATMAGHDGVVGTASFSADRSHIVSTSGRTARLWDQSGNLVAELQGHVGIVRCATFSPDGSRILTASADGTARIWDLTGHELHILRGHTDFVACATFAPDGGHILTASFDKTARLWDADGMQIALLEGHKRGLSGATFSPDGLRVLTASDDRTARVWDAHGTTLLVLQGHDAVVTSAVFSADGSQVLTASDDKTARLWDASGKELAVLRGHDGPVNSAVFSPDGRKILTCSDDGTARLWFVYAEDLLALADTRVTRDFTEAELTLYADLLSDETKLRARKALESAK